jgi:hypothetical protein
MLVAVVVVALAIGLGLNIFLMGGGNFVGFPFPVIMWSRPSPRIPGVPLIDPDVRFSTAGLLVDLFVWTMIALVVHNIVSRLRSRRPSI